MVWSKRAVPDLLNFKAPDPTTRPAVVPGSLVPLPKRELGQQNAQDYTKERIKNTFDKYNVIDQMSQDFGLNSGPDYLAKAEEMYFRANQLHNKAAEIRASGATLEHPNKLGGKTSFSYNSVGQPVAVSNRFGAFINAIAGKESGGSYGAVNSSSGALGKYQIMPGNIAGPGGWDQEALGRNITSSQFLSSPKLQERIARYKLRQYYNKYGPRGAASAWYSGDPNKWKYSKGSQGAYPSVYSYVMDIIRRMNR